MQRQAQQAVLRHALVHVGQDQRDALSTVDRVDAEHAASAPLRDPQLTVGAPGDLPRRVEALGHDTHRESLGRRRSLSGERRREQRGAGEHGRERHAAARLAATPGHHGTCWPLAL
jgi:hypothetical protein